jgi:hypothetical protein
MRDFRCTCGARLFFDNTVCLQCGSELGFLPDALDLVPLQPKGERQWATPRGDYRKCANYLDQGVCNWMVPPCVASDFCQACDLNHVIPDLSQPSNRVLWQEVEKAKRLLVYTLDRLRLPLRSKREDPTHGLAFDIKAADGNARILTGHDDGLITLNLAEADPPEREKIRSLLKERYRTLLGHFRHEVGHYYWDMLVRDSSLLAPFRDLFGDESADYGEALRAHYARPPGYDYAESFISAYASAHPWEDFAETFAHYLHMQDTLETAAAFGFTKRFPANSDVPESRDFDLLIAEWTDLSVAMNALNRSMGLPDAYPFTISPRVQAKLKFAHELVGQARYPAADPCQSDSATVAA